MTVFICKDCTVFAAQGKRALQLTPDVHPYLLPGKYSFSQPGIKAFADFSIRSNTLKLLGHVYVFIGALRSARKHKLSQNLLEKMMTMTLKELQQLASNFGLRECAAYASQTELIRTIQALRGEEPCFSTDKRYDCKENCEWQESCRKLRAIWLR